MDKRFNPYGNEKTLFISIDEDVYDLQDASQLAQSLQQELPYDHVVVLPGIDWVEVIE